MPEPSATDEFVFVPAGDEEDESHWSRDPRTAEDHCAEEETPPALRLSPPDGKRRRKKEPLPTMVFITVDAAELRRLVRDWESRMLGAKITPAEMKKLIIRTRVRENSAKSEAQALSRTRWWLRKMWIPKKEGDLPPDPSALRVLPKNKLLEAAAVLCTEFGSPPPPRPEERESGKRFSTAKRELGEALEGVMLDARRCRLEQDGKNPDLAEPVGAQLALRPVRRAVESAPVERMPVCGVCGRDCAHCSPAAAAGRSASAPASGPPLAVRTKKGRSRRPEQLDLRFTP